MKSFFFFPLVKNIHDPVILQLRANYCCSLVSILLGFIYFFYSFIYKYILYVILNLT